MMGYGNGGGWIWMALGVIVLIGVVVWALIAVNNRAHHGHAPDASAAPDSGGGARSRQVLDERYARGEMTADEYTERLHTLGF
jgi:putative membrane protein